MFAIGFGDDVPTGDRRLRVALEPLAGGELTELWMANGKVTCGESRGVRFSSDDARIFNPTRDSRTCCAPGTTSTPSTMGVGDAERYRDFCAGRVAGLDGLHQAHHPAATVIGGREGRRILQLYWLAGREPGVALENPRQVAAYRYPRQYGETAPTFSRAMLVTPRLLLISGTASIVGHASRHLENTREQAREILANLDRLLARAHSQAPALPAQLGHHTLIKAYLRNREDLGLVEAALRERLPPETPLLVLQGDVCRAELLVELDCVAYSGG